MKHEQAPEYATREAVMSLLADEEISRVKLAEATAQLTGGEEYIDLYHLDHGVRRAPPNTNPIGWVVPKSAVHEQTWSKILTQLPSPRAPWQHSAR